MNITKKYEEIIKKYELGNFIKLNFLKYDDIIENYGLEKYKEDSKLNIENYAEKYNDIIKKYELKKYTNNITEKYKLGGNTEDIPICDKCKKKICSDEEYIIINSKKIHYSANGETIKTCFVFT
jgi:hypothetical protein